MDEKLDTTGRMVVLFSVTLILFAGISSIAGGSTTSKDLGDIQVDIETSDRLNISIGKGDRSLYTVEYVNLRINTADEYDDHSIDLGNVGWGEPDIEDNSDARFPHMKIVLSASIEDKGIHIGELQLRLNVISYKKTSELTFSYVLEDIGALPGGTISLTQDVGTTGMMVRPQYVDSSENLNSYRFKFGSGEMGYYSWKNETSVNGESSASNYITLKDGNRLVISSAFDRDDNSVSITPLDMEETQTGASVPIPEPYDRIPSFVIGVAIAGGMSGGMLYKKRNDFYKKKEGWKTVSLEDSPYYKGDE